MRISDLRRFKNTPLLHSFERMPSHTVNRTHPTPLVFCLDVDGVLTDGSFHYSAEGKIVKVFGPDDHDALLLLMPHLEIRFVTGDRNGFEISKRRIVDDMKMRLDLVSTVRRAEWMKEQFDLDRTIYMGDGIFDGAVFDQVFYSIAPCNALPRTKRKADFVTSQAGGDRAVAEASLHILEQFFSNALTSEFTLQEGQGVWG